MIPASLDYYREFLYNVIRYYLQPYISNMNNISQIRENIFLSDFASTINKDDLKELGITNILSIIVGLYPLYPDDFEYKVVSLRDDINEDILGNLDEIADYINEIVEKNGKILVHCSQGVSRSASVIIAYLIKYEKMDYIEALKDIQNNRKIANPNKGFKKQLIVYELQNSSKKIII